MDSMLPTMILKSIKKGKIKIKENDKNSVEINVENNIINVNLIDVSLNVPPNMGILKKLSEARDFAKNLTDQDLTVKISNRGRPVLKLGKGAKPKFSRLVTKSKSVEIIDLRELRKLDKRLRLK